MRSHMEGNCRQEEGRRGRERERKYTGITIVGEYHFGGNSGFVGYVNKPDCYGQGVVL